MKKTGGTSKPLMYNKTLMLLLLALASCSRPMVYIVRHAEKAPATGAMMSSDVPLSETGEQRAANLANLLAKEGIQHIFSTPTIRTTTTAKPLSERSGVPVQLYHPRDTVDHFLKRVRAIQKGNVLIVGHSNTVDDLVNGLTGKQLLQDLPETEYNNLFRLRKKGDSYRFTRQKF